jgi:hypothetical protein
MVRVAAHFEIMKINTKDMTIKTLLKLKADVYNRATKRAAELANSKGDLRVLATKFQAINKRADYEASRITYVIQLVKIRA